MPIDALIESVASVAMERGVLGLAMLGDDAAARRVADTPASWFFYPLHRTIHAAIRELVELGRPTMDAHAVLLHIRGIDGDARDVTGDILADCLEQAMSPLEVDAYISELHEAWVRRTVEERAKRLADDASTANVQVLYTSLANIGAGLGRRLDWTVEMSEISLDDQHDNRGATTGFLSIDSKTTAKGYPCGHLSFVVAPTGIGKTVLMVQSAMANLDGAIGYATFEMTAQQIKRRALKQITGAWYEPLGEQPKQEWFKAIETLKWADWRFYDPSGSGELEYYIDDLCAWTESQHRNRPFTVLFVDYAQLLGTRTGSSDEYRDLQRVSKGLGVLAKRLEIPIVIGSQATMKDGEVYTKGARRFQEDASLVLLIERKKDESTGHVIIEKNRFGPSGVRLPVWFNQEKLIYQENATGPA